MIYEKEIQIRHGDIVRYLGEVCIIDFHQPKVMLSDYLIMRVDGQCVGWGDGNSGIFHKVSLDELNDQERVDVVTYKLNQT